MQSNVVPLPTTLLKMKSADRLIDEVSQILAAKKNTQRAADMLNWTLKLDEHNRQFNPLS
jgi:hypothetical protein